MKSLLALLMLSGIALGSACNPSAEKCTACKSCERCAACTKQGKTCSVKRDAIAKQLPWWKKWILKNG